MAPWQHRRTTWLLAALGTLILLIGAIFAAPASAVTLDQAAAALRKGQRVYDFANVLSAADARRLNDRLSEVENSGLVEGVVVIVDRLEGMTIEELTLQLAERWKVGRKDLDNALVLAVSVSDRKLRAEVGRDLQGPLPDAVANRILRETAAPAFRRGDFSTGLTDAFDQMVSRLQKQGGLEALPTHAPAPVRSPLPFLLTLLLGGVTVATAFAAWPRGSVPGRDASRLLSIGLGYAALACAVLGTLQAPGSGAGLLVVGLVPAAWATLRLLEGSWTPLGLSEASRLAQMAPRAYWGVLAVGVLLLLFVAQAGSLAVGFLLLAVPLGFALRGYFARVPRRCPDCAGALRWLPEAEEPSFLREDENLEQRLGSVDYDIWRCQKCQRSAVFSHKKLFAPYQECPRCHRRTLTTRTVLDAEPTMWQDGWASDVTECQNPRCGYRDSTRQRRVERGGYRDDGFGGIIIVPPIGGGWGGHGGGWSSGGDSGGGWGGGGFGGIDAGDFGGGGGVDGGGSTVDW